MMKLHNLLFIALAAISLLMPFTASSAEQGKEMAQPSVECTTNKANVPTCKKKISAPESSGTHQKRKECVWTCKQEGPIEVCKGNGPQCNGKSPWD
jgi:hypothetical protein